LFKNAEAVLIDDQTL